MVFLSVVYITDKDLFMSLANRNLLSSEFLDFMNSEILSIPSSDILGSPIKSFILILFNKIIRNQVVNIRSNSRVTIQKLAQEILGSSHYNLSIDDNGISSDSYLYNYIDHTINNLLLFDIVK